MKHFTIALCAFAMCLFPRFSTASTLDYLNSADAVTFLGSPIEEALDAVGETFVADDTTLQDASLGLTTYGRTYRPTWPQAHLEVWLGGPTDYGKAGGLLFKSSQIDFSSLPVVGNVLGESLLEAKLSDWGYTNPLPLIPGDTYSLMITNDPPFSTSNTGDRYMYIAAMEPRVYLDGGEYAHAYFQNEVNDHTSMFNVAFEAVMTPEPAFGSAILVCLLIPRRARRCGGLCCLNITTG